MISRCMSKIGALVIACHAAYRQRYRCFVYGFRDQLSSCVVLTADAVLNAELPCPSI